MPLVKLYGTIAVNPSGFARVALRLGPGVVDVPDRVAAWVAANPAVGELVTPASSPPSAEEEASRQPPRRRRKRAADGAE